MIKNEILRRIPKIDEVLKEHLISDCFAKYGRETVTATTRGVIDGIRADICAAVDNGHEEIEIDAPDTIKIIELIIKKLHDSEKNRLYDVINATGTILHTNLGRAPLCRDAVENVSMVSKGYSNLEYDVKSGSRGSRHSIVSDLICELTGAEDAMVVNNNASATLLVLSSMAAGSNVVVSRGELVEIGGAFRIPDIMEQSGAKLKEIGTTNKTKPYDYENAIDCENTAALMKVHTSNYKIMGFTEETSLEELVAIGKEYDIPVIFDMGNGLMLDLTEYGINEPNVPASLKTGIDVMLFSGDKLLGGPQSGIIIGRKKYIEKMKKHPLARALRVDKMTFAALEETLKKYRDEEIAKRDIPIMRMITESYEDMHMKAESIASGIRKTDQYFAAEVVKVKDQIGGGSAPMVFLPGYAVAISSKNLTAEGIERRLRKNDIPIIARIKDDRLLICVRTISNDDVSYLLDAFEKIRSGK